MFIDSHAHLGDDRIYSSIDQIISNAKAANVQTIVNVCTDEISLSRGQEIYKKYPEVLLTGATPPHDVINEGEKLFPLFEKAALEGSLVAVGETGLDYFYHKETKEEQKKLFIRYIKLALRAQLPLMIHCRDAFTDLFDILDDEYPSKSGILHCFTGNQEEAYQLIKRGWYLSFSGIITYKKSDELREVVKNTPLHQILIETDSPYLAPQSRRSKTNEPSFLPETAMQVALLKGISLEECAAITSANTYKAFNISLS